MKISSFILGLVVLIQDKGATEKNSLCVLNCVLLGNRGEFDSYQMAQQNGGRRRL